MLTPARACLVLVAISYTQYAQADLSECDSYLFSASIENIEVDNRLIPVIYMDKMEHEKSKMAIDTGSNFNTFFMRDPEIHVEDASLTPGRVLRIKEFGQHMFFMHTYLPTIVQEKIRIRDIDGIVSPQTILDAGFVVLDFKNSIMLGFTSDRDVRKCYPLGSRISRTKNSLMNNDFSVPVMFDGDIWGDFFIDTGAFLSKVFTDKIKDEAAELSEEYAYHTMNGDEVIPRVSLNHTIKIGDKEKKLERVALLNEKYDEENLSYIGSLGYDALKDSVIIIPPRDAGYWEIIFE